MDVALFEGRSRVLLHDTLALDSDAELSDLEMVIGGEVEVIAEDDEMNSEDDGRNLYVAVPLVSQPMGQAATTARIDAVKSQWEQKFGKQYPAFNPKKHVHSFLAEHDYYHSVEAKRARFKDESEPALSRSTPLLNKSQHYDDLTDLTHGQNIVLRISEDL